jgi:molecular chaperone GrpE
MKNKNVEEEKNMEEDRIIEEELVEESQIVEESVADQAEVPAEEENVDAEDLVVQYLNGWKRCQADFENFKKRQAESQKDLLRYSTQNIVLQILPVIDNFQASTAHIPEDQKSNPWVTGIMYIQKQLEQVLVDNGVTEMEAKNGDSFDPARHEAVADMECKGCKAKDYKFSNKIKQVVTRGYMMGEKIVRPARVIVE